MTSRQWAVDARPPPQRRRTQVSSFLEYTKAATERRVGCPKIAENKGGETLWSFIFHISMRWFEGSPSLPFRGGWSLTAKMVADQGQRSSRSGRSTRQSPEVLCEVCVPSLGAAAFGASCKLNLTWGIGVERSNTGERGVNQTSRAPASATTCMTRPNFSLDAILRGCACGEHTRMLSGREKDKRKTGQLGATKNRPADANFKPRENTALAFLSLCVSLT